MYENLFDKYMAILEKGSTIIKKINSEDIYNKISKSWKKVQHNRKLSTFLYTSNIAWFSL